MKYIWTIVLIILVPLVCFGQFKSQSELPPISEAISSGSNFILGFLNPDKFQMHHTFTASYMSMGKYGMMVNSYMNTIDYQISNPLFLRLNIGLMNSPYNNLPIQGFNKPQFFGGAELYYRPSENTTIKFGVDFGPGYYSPYGYYYTPFGRSW